MTFHALVSSLLPLEYREQVLGDLHERGFRLRDVANVLPRVWASSLRRSVTGPAPRLDLASVEVLIVRTQQLSDQGRIVAALAVGFAGMSRVYPLTSGPVSAAVLMLA